MSKRILRLTLGDMYGPTAIIGLNLGDMTNYEADQIRDRIARENPWLGVSVDPLPTEKPRKLLLKFYHLPEGTTDFGFHADKIFCEGRQECRPTT